MADVVVGAVGRVEFPASVDQRLEFRSKRPKLTRLRLDVAQLGGEQMRDVAAWGLASAANVEYAADLGQRETGALGSFDERDAFDCHLVVDAISVRLSLRFLQQPAFLIEANGWSGDAAGVGQVTDVHETTVPLDIEPWYKVYGEVVNVTLLYFEDCPHWKVADDHLRTLAAELPTMTIERRIVNTVEDAEATRFRGSPSIIVDGVDPFADPDDPVGLSCRMYQTPNGPAGSPTLDQLRRVTTTKDL